MITSLKIQNFKALQDHQFDFKNLNVFTGANGMGKSTLIQTLLLLRQSYITKSKIENLTLKGEYIDLGVGKDILSYAKDAKKDSIVFDIKYSDQVQSFFEFYIQVDTEKDDGKIEQWDYLRLKDSSRIDNSIFQKSLFIMDNYFQYLSADRIGPKDINDTSSWVTLRKELGKNGEFAAYYLEYFGKEKIINEQLCHPNTNLNVEIHLSLIRQISYWISEFSPETSIKTSYIPEIHKVRTTFSIVDGEYKPTHVGFGLTYSLPILIALLTTKKGGTIIIENPESHLHPSAQAKMAELIAKTAASGVQVFIETHSDHIINGIMISSYEHYKAKKTEKNPKIGISNEDVSIYYFSRNQKSNSSNVDKINLSETGRISKAPKGFFDQFGIDMKRLLK